MPVAHATTRWACSLCGGKFDTEVEAATCEARGGPPTVAPGWIVARWQGNMTASRGEYLAVWGTVRGSVRVLAHSRSGEVEVFPVHPLIVKGAGEPAPTRPYGLVVWWEQSGLLGDREDDTRRFVPLDEVTDEPGVAEAVRAAEEYLRGLGLEPKPWRSGPPPWVLK